MTDDGSRVDDASLEIDVDDHDGSLYRILSSAVVPRPIAWVSTSSEDGVDNLAPYSFFTVASVAPPVLLFAPVDGTDGLKDTPRNARETGEFVVNLVTEELAEAMNETSATLPAGESEFDHATLERAESAAVDPPRVAGAKVAFECALHDLIDVGGSTLVLGEVRHVHLDESVTSDGKIDVDEIDAVGRLAGSRYARLADRFSLERPP
ncbi:flavin reductase family protein [Natrinema sp. 1APR25-10V2]|uniref:flavin reductase family protein n=1 Tax=Natrinema sp. 1APR25-10V2 TaxID=2951081 RepID=UPI0028767C74|nr:flavin reductase family protein [Natrinema sp. 1APR25-10V2]MDS0474244.1 flavin reductase family protein [Natrinema sp. 1APR25-10V2]